MDPSWAESNITAIRTLMERSSLYRRALAPICLAIGVLGLGATVLAHQLHIDGAKRIVGYWMIVGTISAGTALFLVRRQALKAGEHIFSPPARRVVQQVLAPFTAGFCLGLIALTEQGSAWLTPRILVPLWMILYGCAMNAAGFFTARGIRLFGFVFILIALGFLSFKGVPPLHLNMQMGLVFGGLHLLYGVYLYFTENKQA